MTIESMLAVLQAARDGKTIQRRDKGSIEWKTLQGEPDWDFAHAEFRVKLEAREFWINRYDRCSSCCNIHQSLSSAERGAQGEGPELFERIHVREVLPGDEKEL